MTVLPRLVSHIEDLLFSHSSVGKIASETASFIVRRFEEHIRNGLSAGSFFCGPVISTHASSDDLPEAVHASVMSPGEALLRFQSSQTDLDQSSV